MSSFLVCALLLASCATKTAYYNDLGNLVSNRKYSEAANLIEQSKEKEYGKKNALLYYLDRGMLLHIAGDYAASNAAFERAKQLAAEYFTKSVTTEASTLLVSDNMRPYYGEDFERALINVFSALNYVFLGKESEALVEARQVDHFLKTLQVDYGHKNTYQEDAFARYLMGMLYENQGQINDAFISYRKALDAYRMYEKAFGVPCPKDLPGDAVRTARRMGFNAEIKEIEKTWGRTESSADAGGEAVVVVYNGFSPEKIDSFFEISFGRGWIYVDQVNAKGEEAQKVEQARGIARSILSKEIVRMAFPKYTPIGYRVKNIGVYSGGSSVPGTVVEDIGAIAEKGLEDRIGRIRARTIARSVIKFALAKNISQKVGDKKGEVAGWLAKKLLTVAATATELADKRSWRSLPDKIILARMPLPEGEHEIVLKLADSRGVEVASMPVKVRIKDGKKTFVVARVAQ